MSALLNFIQYEALNTWSVHLLLENSFFFTKNYHLAYFNEFIKKVKNESVHIENNKTYKILGVRSYGFGAYPNRVVSGSELTMKTYYKAKKDHLFWCKVDTKNGAFGIITEELEDGFGSSNMTFAEINLKKINTNYLQLFFKSKKYNKYMDNYVIGATNRKYIKFDDILNEIQIPLPLLNIQEQIVKKYYERIDLAEAQEKRVNIIISEIENYLFNELGLQNQAIPKSDEILNFINFQNLYVWSCKDLLDNSLFSSTKHKSFSLNQKSILFEDVFRGKSPKYSDKSTKVILNQKCNRWNDLKLEYSKTVDSEWFEKIDKKFFTRKGDILINSTGEGTIGRATHITKEFENLIYDSHILLLRVNKNEINPEFLTYFINSDLGQKQIDNIKSAVATKQTELGINNLKNLQFVIPPIEEQNKIVLHIHSLQEKIKILKQESEINRITALEEFEKEVFSEA